MNVEDELLDLGALRYSVGPRNLTPPGPSAEQWDRAADLALRATDHGSLRPLRFVVLGDSHRVALAWLFAAGARETGQAAEDVERAQARAFNGPGLVARVARVHDEVPDVPPHEQCLCVGAALMNLMSALHLMGIGAKALSDASVSDRATHDALCGPGERLACWVLAGRPDRAAQARAGASAAAVIGNWPAL